MNICYKCHQPITRGSSFRGTKMGAVHTKTEVQTYWDGATVYNSGSLGCPTESQIIPNLEVAMKQGFKPQFCRTHELRHKLPEEKQEWMR